MKWVKLSGYEIQILLDGLQTLSCQVCTADKDCLKSLGTKLDDGTFFTPYCVSSGIKLKEAFHKEEASYQEK